MSKYTQREFSEGLYELTDEAAAELISSKYYNEDLTPASQSERTWTTYNIAMLWVGMVICITSFSYAAALVALGLSPVLSIINVLLGNLIVLIPMQLNSHAGTRYGIPFPVFARISFGQKGAQIPSLSRAIVAAGWCAVQCWVGGMAFSAMIGAFVPSWDVSGTGRFVGFGIFILITLLVGMRGAEGIKWLENIGGPILIFLCAGLLIWTLMLGSDYNYTLGTMLAQSSNPELLAENGGMAFVFMAGITSNIAVWATLALNIPDFSRYAKNQKAQFRGQLYAMPTAMVALAVIGALFAEVTRVAFGKAEHDPTAVLLQLDNKFVVVLVSLAVVIATLTTNMAANVVAPSNGFCNLMPRVINYRKGVIITCILCIVYRPWWIFGDAGAFMFSWLGTVGTVLAPVAAILVADYFFVKQKRVDVAALFDEGENRYTYTNGWNIRAIIAWICAVILPLMGTFGIGGDALKWITANSYIFGFIVAMVIYILLMKGDTKSYISEEEFDTITDKAYMSTQETA